MIRRMGMSSVAVGAALLALGVPGALAKTTAPATATASSSLKAAASTCDGQSYTQAFLPFGDANLYALAPQGSFEAGADRWTITGAGRVVADPAFPGGPAADTASLELAPGASATSPPICANANTPTFRFFVRGVSAAADYGVDVTYLAADGNRLHGAASLMATTGWQPTPEIRVKTSKIAVDSTGWGAIQVTITAPSTGALRIDDLYLDPRLR